jgi:hypothetical protein
MKKTSVQNLIINALLLVEAVLIVFFLLRMITKEELAGVKGNMHLFPIGTIANSNYLDFFSY